MRRILFSIPIALFVVLAGYFGAALYSGKDPHQLPAMLIDEPAPAFNLAGLKGEDLASAGLAGQVMVINFFASWCAPCRLEHPLLMRLSEGEHVPVYGIAWKDERENTERFIAQLGDPYRRIGLDENARAGIDFGITGVPETFVIDKTGHIRRHYNQPLTPEQVQNDLLPLLRALNRS
jgi:cytochrome c biogenesis protein CcmG/thiol:disulfide interchange protein DsbE